MTKDPRHQAGCYLFTTLQALSVSLLLWTLRGIPGTEEPLR